MTSGGDGDARDQGPAGDAGGPDRGPADDAVLRPTVGSHVSGPASTVTTDPAAGPTTTVAIAAAVAAFEAAASGATSPGPAEVALPVPGDAEGVVRVALPIASDPLDPATAEGGSATPGVRPTASTSAVSGVPATSGVSGTGRTGAASSGGAAGDAVPVPAGTPSAAASGPTPTPALVPSTRIPDLDRVRPDLAEVLDRHARTRDEARPDAVARRRSRGQRTARENLDDLCDAGTLVEYGALAVAAQRTRRSLEDLIARTPADGLVCGVAEVGGAEVGRERSSAVVLAYDATVLAGTQGVHNHAKTDRMFQVAGERGLPVVFLTEGGGGRPGDVDVPTGAWLDVPTFHAFARLSGVVPLVGVASGRCFAGNAALLGCCDVVIATEDATIGLGGPAMIEGGGLGVYAPEEVGPIDVQTANGVVDVAVADEAEAIDVARRWLSYFQGPFAEWTTPDARLLRHAVPESRTRAYDVRRVLEGLADVGTVLEVRREFGESMVTALIRVEGRPYGVIANDPSRLGGAIDSDAADKAARFLGLCDAHRLPVISLCDTPGFMVGPASEETGAVRHVSRMFVVGAKLSVPLVTIVLRKAYGLGAMAMAGGHLRVPLATVGWPTSELGPMGLEGAVRLGFRDELAAAAEGEERDGLFARMVEAAYETGKGLSVATAFELDDVIDPLDTRRWITATLGGAPGPRTAEERRAAAGSARWVDTW